MVGSARLRFAPAGSTHPTKSGPMPTPLPLLDSLTIATPCPASWDDMDGDDRVRYCSLCQQSVHDVSAMTRAEATALIQQTKGRLCLRLFRRSDGKVMTRDCPVGVLRAARRRIAAVVGGWVLLVLMAFGWFTSRPGALKAARTQMQQVKAGIDPPQTCIAGEVAPLPRPPEADEN
jgi:hypothetical protein